MPGFCFVISNVEDKDSFRFPFQIEIHLTPSFTYDSNRHTENNLPHYYWYVFCMLELIVLMGRMVTLIFPSSPLKLNYKSSSSSSLSIGIAIVHACIIMFCGRALNCLCLNQLNRQRPDPRDSELIHNFFVSIFVNNSQMKEWRKKNNEFTNERIIRWIIVIYQMAECLDVRINMCVFARKFPIVSKWNPIYLHKNGSMKRFNGLRRCKRTKVAKHWVNGNSKSDSGINQQQQNVQKKEKKKKTKLV